ncbi:MAG: MFS transporter [Betaproteobacteria bacterium]|nr:MFS transporter [Betaproteobacteria bacterium]
MKDAVVKNAFALALWLNGAMIICTVGLFAVPVMAPAIAEDLGVSTTLVGPYMALTWIASILTSVLAGALLRRFGAMGVTQLCLLMCAAAMLFGSTGLAVMLLVAAIAVGLAFGIETPASSYLLARVTPARQQPFIFSFKQTGAQVGGMLSGILYPFLLPLVGWRGAMGCVAVLMLAFSFALQRPRARFDSLYPPRDSSHRATFAETVLLIWRSWPMMRAALASFGFLTIQICFNSFLVSFLVKERGESLAAAGVFLAVAQAGGLLGRLLWGMVSGRLMSAAALLAGIGVAMTLCSVLLGFRGTQMSAPMLGLLCFVFGLTAGGWNGVFLAEVARLCPPDAVGRIIGVIFLPGTTGMIVGPVIFGISAGAWGFGNTYTYMAVFPLAGALCLLVRGGGRRVRPI